MSEQRQPDSEYSKRYAEKRKAKPVKFDFYLDDPVENQIYEQWQKEPNKKQLFIKLYIEHLASTKK